MSRRAWNPLVRGGILVDPPKTIGDVLDLCTRDLFKEILSLGPRRVA